MEGYQADAFQTEYEADIEFEKLKNLTNLFSVNLDMTRKYLEQEDIGEFKYYEFSIETEL